MAQFDYSRQLSTLMSPEIMSSIGDMREHRGKQALYEATRPDVLESLVEVAKIQSTGASNKIENIATSDKRLRDLMAERAEPKNRDEREIAGYRFVLDTIHERHDAVPVTPGVILQLHRDLYRFTGDSFAGRWKDSDNVIAERSASGEMVARFRPTSAAAFYLRLSACFCALSCLSRSFSFSICASISPAVLALAMALLPSRCVSVIVAFRTRPRTARAHPRAAWYTSCHRRAVGAKGALIQTLRVCRAAGLRPCAPSTLSGLFA